MSTATTMKMLADIFKALGHPTRIGIVLMLRDGERCVCEIMRDLGTEQQSNISQHLAVLREAGILASRKEGLSVYYRLRHPEVLEMIGCSERVLEREVIDIRQSLDELANNGGAADGDIRMAK